MMNLIKKINILKNDHLLLNENWKFISKEMEIFHDKNGINCYDYLDKELKDEKIEGRWIGFLHNVINYPQEYPNKYNCNKILSLASLVKNNYFLEKLNSCLGIFVFTDQNKIFLKKETGFQNIKSIKHPAPDFIFGKSWESNKKILHVGQQLRKYHSFLELESKNEKIMLNPKNCEYDLVEMQSYSNKKVSILRNIDLNEYLNLLKNSVVFLDLYDVAACNTIIECIILGVPILIKKLDGCVEYLGDDYPFYFDDLADANKKINDDNLILETNKYLNKINKEDFKVKKYLKNFYNEYLYFLK